MTVRSKCFCSTTGRERTKKNDRVLSKELALLGVEMTERRAVHDSIAKLVDPLSPSHLSDEGLRELNRFSYGGFEVLSQKWFEDRPREVESFLPFFSRNLHAELDK